MDELGKVFESVAEYFGLLAEPTRLRILHCLCNGELSVNEVVEAAGLTQANTSRHLNMLYRANIVDRRREGTGGARAPRSSTRSSIRTSPFCAARSA